MKKDVFDMSFAGDNGRSPQVLSGTTPQGPQVFNLPECSMSSTVLPFEARARYTKFQMLHWQFERT
jgi:hypothetical protein